MLLYSDSLFSKIHFNWKSVLCTYKITNCVCRSLLFERDGAIKIFWQPKKFRTPPLWSWQAEWLWPSNTTYVVSFYPEANSALKRAEKHHTMMMMNKNWKNNGLEKYTLNLTPSASYVQDAHFISQTWTSNGKYSTFTLHDDL